MDPHSATELARWTIAAFMGHPEASHADLVEMLESIRLPVADHAVAMLPIAFGRRLLDGLVALPSTYRVGDREVAYADDTIFVAASELAATASNAEIETIALRSAEVNAVNQALHAGSQPGDLVLATVMLALPAEKGPWRFGGAGSTVEQLVRQHGADLAVETRVLPQRVRKGEATMQIDIVVKHGERETRESFIGIAPTIIEAQKQALQQFSRSRLHVLGT